MWYKMLIASCLFVFSGGSVAVAQDFRVQIVASDDSIPLSYFKKLGLEQVSMSTDQMGLYRYSSGAYRTREQAETVLQNITAKGFPNATIIDLEEQRALGGARCAYYRPDLPVFIREIDDKTTAYYIYFDLGSFALSAESNRHIDLVAQALKANPKFSLKIIGQTDAIGSAEANLELATNRARAARNYLINSGIRTDRLTIKVYGEAEAERPNKGEDDKDLPENRKLNRRVVLAVIKP